MSKKLIIASAIALGGIGIVAGVSTFNPAVHGESGSSNNNTTSALLSSTEGLNIVDETVYVFLNADGSSRKTIASDWTKDSLGNDAYNKSENTAQSPIDVKISYFLDGKEISASDIKGKSGHVKISYDFTNNSKKTGVLNGQAVEMYSPYVVLSGLVMPNSTFKNISVKNGKFYNDGTRTAVIGVTLPGMKYNLNIATADFEIPESFEVEADVTNFELSMAMSLATSKVFSNLDTSKLSTVEEIQAQLGQLSDAMTKLLGGSEQIYNGLSELYDKSGVLSSGAEQLAIGSLEVTTGTQKLADGIKSASDGATALSNGAAAAAKGSEELLAGATALKEGAGKLAAGASQAVDGSKSLSDSLSQVSAGSDGLRQGAKSTFDELLEINHANISPLYAKLNNGAAMPALTIENFKSTLEGIVTKGKQTVAYLRSINQNETAQELEVGVNAVENTALVKLNNYMTFYKGVLEYSGYVDQISTGATTLSNKLAELKPGAVQVSEGSTKVEAGVSNLSSGLNNLKTGANTLSGGLKTLTEGSSKLYTGTKTLNAGISNLSSNTPALVDGVSKLKDGSKAIYDGLNQFNEEGIKRIVSIYQDKVVDLANRLRMMIQIAKNDNSKAKYIYRVDEIK